MLYDENKQLAERAVAYKHWVWMSHMPVYSAAIHCGGVVIEGDATYAIVEGWGATQDGGGTHDTGGVPAGLLPDLSHPAMIGFLLAMARKAWGSPALHAQWSVGFPAGDPNGNWGIHRIPYVMDIFGSTEVESLICALEQAPDD